MGCKRSEIHLRCLSNASFPTPTDGFVSLMVWMTAFVSDATMALVEDGALLGSRQLDMGNSGSWKYRLDFDSGQL